MAARGGSQSPLLALQAQSVAGLGLGLGLGTREAALREVMGVLEAVQALADEIAAAKETVLGKAAAAARVATGKTQERVAAFHAALDRCLLSLHLCVAVDQHGAVVCLLTMVLAQLQQTQTQAQAQVQAQGDSQAQAQAQLRAQARRGQGCCGAWRRWRPRCARSRPSAASPPPRPAWAWILVCAWAWARATWLCAM